MTSFHLVQTYQHVSEKLYLLNFLVVVVAVAVGIISSLQSSSVSLSTSPCINQEEGSYRQYRIRRLQPLLLLLLKTIVLRRRLSGQTSRCSFCLFRIRLKLDLISLTQKSKHTHAHKRKKTTGILLSRDRFIYNEDILYIRVW